ncbi:hypothetical protein [Longimicrobium sp.]|uniref:hypothetical protein n=1 Tax=Longimicrobium sp. TaxID=2029185 RepID=UPI002E2F1FB1|nr:hypothetical protein [Longimicrobium sp.]HEX6036675.1 hypothetical protein [Longimicrobium sp.]
MVDQDQTGWDMEEREERANHALAAYRERRRLRRGDDTWFGAGEGLLDEAGLNADEVSRRRMDVIQEAVAVGMSDELAEMLYDVAHEEGLDPAMAFELVRSGMGVLPPAEGLENAPQFATTDKYRPEWLEEPVDPDTVLRERTLRFSFRRLRGLLEQHTGDAAAAFRAFAREPDVGAVGY